MRVLVPYAISDGAGAVTRASAATYYDSAGVMQSAAADVMRLSYDPAALSMPPRYLIEAASTNLALYSQAFDGAVWVKTSCSVTADPATAPDGSSTGDLVTFSDDLGDVSQTVTGLTVGHTYTASIFLKAGSLSQVRLRMAKTSVHCDVDLIARTADVTLGPATAQVEEVGFGWLRVAITYEAGFIFEQFTLRNNSGLNAGDVIVWGAQFEHTAWPTSYIATTGAVATRAADVVSGTGLLHSNLPEPGAGETAWASGTDFLKPARAIRSTTHRVYQALRGEKFTCTISNATPAVVTAADHGRVEGEPVSIDSTGTPPAGIDEGQVLYVRNPSVNTFQLALEPNGAPIATSSAGSGVHTCVVTSNLNKVPEDNVDTYWADLQPTNRWAPFDTAINTSAAGVSLITYLIKPGQRVQGVGLVQLANCYAARVRVTLDGEVLEDRTFDLRATPMATYLEYFQAERRYRKTLPVLGLNNSAGAIVSVTLVGAPIMSVGAILLGRVYNAGKLKWDAEGGYRDFGRVREDAAGNETYVRGQLRRTLKGQLLVTTAEQEGVRSLFEQLRGVPCLWEGTTGHDLIRESVTVYGTCGECAYRATSGGVLIHSLSLLGLAQT